MMPISRLAIKQPILDVNIEYHAHTFKGSVTDVHRAITASGNYIL
jgi:hypothetical protein